MEELLKQIEQLQNELDLGNIDHVTFYQEVVMLKDYYKSLNN